MPAPPACGAVARFAQGGSRMKPQIVFIHGMFLTPKSWWKWVEFFEADGFDCVAPAWPLHDDEPAHIRANPPAGLGLLTLGALYDHYRGILGGMAEPPVLIGHSLGGLIVQKMVSEGLARAGVAISPVAPNRMMALDWGFLRNTTAITNPLAGDDPFIMTAEGFRENFGNTMSEVESRRAFEAYAVPESRQVLRDILGDGGKIDVEKPHVPLLFIGAEEDRIIPSTLVMRNAHAYTDARSHRQYTSFSGRGHFICGQNGWEEVAERTASWLESHLMSVRA